jgi:multicomponent Na+:H+ antiporter subunit F
MSLYDFLYYIILPILSLSAVLVFIRFLLGPSLSDRVVSLDLLITIGIGIIAIYSIITNQPTFLDIAMILALIAFLGTVAFSYYLEKRDKNE